MHIVLHATARCQCEAACYQPLRLPCSVHPGRRKGFERQKKPALKQRSCLCSRMQHTHVHGAADVAADATTTLCDDASAPGLVVLRCVEHATVPVATCRHDVATPVKRSASTATATHPHARSCQMHRSSRTPQLPQLSSECRPNLVGNPTK